MSFLISNIKLEQSQSQNFFHKSSVKLTEAACSITFIIGLLYVASVYTCRWVCLFFRSLGDTMCKIEFDTAQMNSEMITRLESLCNQYIREQRKMYPTFYHDLDDPAVQKVATTTMSSMLIHLWKLHTLFWV